MSGRWTGARVMRVQREETSGTGERHLWIARALLEGRAQGGLSG